MHGAEHRADLGDLAGQKRQYHRKGEAERGIGELSHSGGIAGENGGVIHEFLLRFFQQRAALFVSMRESYQKCRGLSRIDPLRETAKDAIISMTF